MISSEQRPIKLRSRSDLVIQKAVYQDDCSWIIKDPVVMKYFRVQEPERIALEMIDGETSYHEIRDQLEKRFPEQRFRVEDVHMLVNSFHNNGLLISNASGQTAPLTVRRNKELQQKAVQLLMSVMSIRFPGVDPERFLNWLYPKVRWFFMLMIFWFLTKVFEPYGLSGI